MCNIKFRYIDYSQSLMDSLKSSREKDTLIVFSDYLLKKNYSDREKISLFEKPQEVCTIDEFYGKIFLTDRVILKEAKRMLTLFSSLDREIKKNLDMQNYYDFITLADQFFKFFRQSKENLIEDYSNLESWQRERIEKFYLMKGHYEKFLGRENFIPADWIKSIENLSLEYIKGFKKIIFVDQLEFTALEQESIKRIAEIVPVEIVLQCGERDFDEERFKLKTVSMALEEKIKIALIETEDAMDEGITLLQEFGKEKGNDIFTPNLEKNRLAEVFPGYFRTTALETLDNREIYLLLKGLYEILLTSEPRLKGALALQTLEEYITERSFRVNYGITSQGIKEFYSLLRDDYKYYSPQVMEMETFQKYLECQITEVLNRIYADIERIGRLKKVEEFESFFRENLKIIEIIEPEYTDILEKFFEALELAQSSENLYGKDGFKNLFSEDLSKNIFNLILKYMNNIEVASLERDGSSPLAVVKSLNLAKERRERKIYFTDLTADNLPGRSGGDIFLTEEQKKNMGIITAEEEKLVKKYRFFQSIFTCGEAVLLSDKNSKMSPFLEELIIYYNLEFQKRENGEKISREIMKNSLSGAELYPSKLEEEDELPKDSEDYPEGIRLGAYSYTNLEGCSYKFYLENILLLSPVSESYERNMSSKFLGIFVHETLEKIARRKYKDIKDRGDFSLSHEYIRENLMGSFRENRYKIPLHLDSYFQEILLENIVKNIGDFYRVLEERYTGKRIERFQPEKSGTDRKPFILGETDVYLSGRVDLLIESQFGNCIIDYKTGKKNDRQLDFYAIMLYGSQEMAEKAIFNVISGKIEWYEEGKKVLTTEEMREKIENFLSEKSYLLAEKTGICTYCQYINICRRELKKK
ncbi:MAG: PD-(D/E)XK nuclease family protein [Fusobacteriaceae bacterium]